MGRERIVYREWIVALGRDPVRSCYDDLTPPEYNMEIIAAVTGAMDRLDTDEAAFIRLHYMQGLTCREIGEMTGREIHRLEAQHDRAVRRLRTGVCELLGGKYGIRAEHNMKCPLCAHPAREAINQLIKAKKDTETWKRIYRVLRDEYGLKIATPQTFIGHKKYHMA